MSVIFSLYITKQHIFTDIHLISETHKEDKSCSSNSQEWQPTVEECNGESFVPSATNRTIYSSPHYSTKNNKDLKNVLQTDLRSEHVEIGPIPLDTKETSLFQLTGRDTQQNKSFGSNYVENDSYIGNVEKVSGSVQDTRESSRFTVSAKETEQINNDFMDTDILMENIPVASKTIIENRDLSKSFQVENNFHLITDEHTSNVGENENEFQSLSLLSQINSNVLVPVENVIIEEIYINRPNDTPTLTNSPLEKGKNDEEEGFDTSNGDNVSNADEDDSEYFPSDQEEDLEEKNIPKNVNNKTDVLVPSRENARVNFEENDFYDENDEPVFIRESKLNEFGERIRQKVHCCYFCNKLYKDLGKHFPKKHATEVEVAKLLLLEKKSVERRNGFINLTRAGDYYHNCEVLKKKSGELILARMPTISEKSLYGFNDYSPCPNCLGFMLKRHLWHHIKYGCTLKKRVNNKRRQVIAESTALLVHTFSDIVGSTDFAKNIIVPLKNDIISMVCRQDNLIMKFAAMQFEKYHTSQNDLIRQSMRQLGRLLIELRKIDTNKIWLSDWLKPKYFDNVVSAVKNVCHEKYSIKSRPQFDIPSLALKLGYSLRKCVSIQKGICLRNEDLTTAESLNSFLSIMDLEWSVKISSSALTSLNKRKMNVTELLPLTDDLMSLNKFLNENLLLARSNLNEDVNYINWSRLASVTLSKIILFNKRRSGEASKMTLQQYIARPNWTDECAAEFQKSLSAFETNLASKLTIVQIEGKRGRTVSILLTKDIKDSIDMLLLHRSKFASLENIYLFSRTSPSMDHIRGHDCLRNLAFEAKLTRPDLINATKLRKYIATVCQVFNLSENETDWLARHLGHDIRIHREFYRLHDSSVELAKISRILLAVESGKAHEFSGKKLNEINICGKSYSCTL